MSISPYSIQRDLPVPGNASSLISTIQNAASWIWATEDVAYPLPIAPGNVQRAFRKTWSNQSPISQTARETTILITADNYFELFVNGILVHPANNTQLALDKPTLYSVPVSGNRVTYAVRVVNIYGVNGLQTPNPAGLRAAIRISFSPLTAEPEFFYTGSDQSWLSSRIFGNGWEQPGYDDTQWTPAIIMPEIANNSRVWPPLAVPDSLRLATAIPQPAGTPTTITITAAPTESAQINDGVTGRVTLRAEQLAGVVVGSVVGAALIGALVSFLLVRRKYVLGRVI